MKYKKNVFLGIDFDGTLVKHQYPDIGEAVPNALECLKEYQKRGWKLVLNTMRSGQTLDEAVQYLKNNGVELYGINNNPDQKTWTDSPKVYAHYYIDDAAIGCPLLYPSQVFAADPIERPYVDWVAVNRQLDKLTQIL